MGLILLDNLVGSDELGGQLPGFSAEVKFASGKLYPVTDVEQSSWWVLAAMLDGVAAKATNASRPTVGPTTHQPPVLDV